MIGVAVLLLVGLAPAVAAGGRQPATVLLVPLAGAVVAGMAATIELMVPGPLLLWVFVVGAAVALASLPLIRRAWADPATSIRGAGPRRWRMAATAAVAAAAAWPLLAQAAPAIGYDAAAIWLIHTALIAGGHGPLLHGLTDPSYRVSHPPYPPLAAAAGALVDQVDGRIDDHTGVVVTTVLTASAVALVATGFVRLVPARVSVWRRLGVLVLAVMWCGGAFGIAQQPGVLGYQDLLWSSAVVAACVYGLVLPVRTRDLAVAFAALAVAALTKQEGLIVGGAVSLLIAMRASAHGWFLGGTRPRPRGSGVVPRVIGLAVLPLLPGLAWAFAAWLEGVGGSAFQGRAAAGESLVVRLGVTIGHLPHELPLAGAAFVVAVAGIATLRQARTAMEVGHPAWMWAAGTAGLVVMVATYGLGRPEIHWWLSTSLNRTTIFDEILCLADMVVWTTILLVRPTVSDSALSGLLAIEERAGRSRRRSETGTSSPDDRHPHASPARQL